MLCALIGTDVRGALRPHRHASVQCSTGAWSHGHHNERARIQTPLYPGAEALQELLYLLTSTKVQILTGKCVCSGKPGIRFAPSGHVESDVYAWCCFLHQQVHRQWWPAQSYLLYWYKSTNTDARCSAADNNITVFTRFLHMHQIGSHMRVTQKAPSGVVISTDTSDYYDLYR